MSDGLVTDAARDAADVPTSSAPPSAAGRSRKEPLGRDFGKLWTAAAFSNLADGLGRTAVPLIATTLTRDPLGDLGDRRARVPSVAGLRASGRHAGRPIRPAHHHGRRERHPRCRGPVAGGPHRDRSDQPVDALRRNPRLRTRRDPLRQRDERRHPRRRHPAAARAREREDAGGAGHDRQLHRAADRGRAVRRRTRAAAVGGRRGLHRADRARPPAAALGGATAARPQRGSRSRRARHRGGRADR